jgi:serine/threonine protein kinase
MTENKGDLTGRVLGNCTLERLLGQGGMGAVYLAKQERPSRWVAVKVLHPNIALDNHGNEEFLARFRREADVIARLEHVNIMPIYEYGEQNGSAFLVMPYVSGGSLKDVLIKRGALTLQEATVFIDQAASALDYAHSQGVVHRDLKPANFLLHADGRLVLADFGIARIIEESLSTGATLTSAGTILGTPEYMAPEMASGAAIDYRADIYELGIVLFQMLCGRVPFTGTTPYSVVIKQIQERLPSVQQINPALPAAVDTVIQTATAKQPDKRYQAASTMAQALRQVGSGSAQSYYPPLNIPSIDHSTSLSPKSQPLVLPATQTPPYGQAPTGATWNNQSPSTGVYPPPQAYPAQSPRTGQYQPPLQKKKRQPWGLILGVVLLLVLIIGGVVFGSQLVKGNGQANQPQGPANIPASKTTPTLSPTSAPTPTPSPTSAPTPSPTPITASNTLLVGNQLYSTNRPGPNCDNSGGSWTLFNGVHLNCLNNRIRLTNPDQNQGLEGVLLTKIPAQNNFPDNYVIQTHIQHENAKGDIGIYFRNQPGAQNQGVYTFLVHPDGTWSVTIYDNASGAPTELKKGSLGVDPYGQLNLAVVANGSQYSVYLNSNLLTTVSDGTYLQGTVGLVVGSGASLLSTNFMLSNTAS